MDKLEKMELISAKTGVTLEESKRALEATDWDELEAVLYITALKNTDGSKLAEEAAKKVLENEKKEEKKAEKKCEKKEKSSSFGHAIGKFFDWMGNVIKRTWEIKFKVFKDDEEKLSVPLLIVILLTMGFFWITIPVMIIGLANNYKYRFEGVDTVQVNLNDLSERASRAFEE